MQQKYVQQYVLMFTAMYHVLVFMVYDHTKNEKYSLCVPLILFL